LPKADLAPVYALAIAPEKRNDEVSSVAHCQTPEEDPSLAWEQHGDTTKLSFGVKAKFISSCPRPTAAQI